ncbi:hypothetical protein D187_009624 [Cystobacter fuscus DSM 2262]|uniref:Uncharacterized protein n=1 Tax=Cystobacter fuscus (strain ATCC 25194 / DSM 2262 / NBRC 100088 / M29) TaxID=1242864 RepID=S9QFL1_CYSF2|nr:hypothetical protein D187_009624 [Cystobacter fuscus DSM 2262]
MNVPTLPPVALDRPGRQLHRVFLRTRHPRAPRGPPPSEPPSITYLTPHGETVRESRRALTARGERRLSGEAREAAGASCGSRSHGPGTLTAHPGHFV